MIGTLFDVSRSSSEEAMISTSLIHGHLKSYSNQK